MALAPYFSRVYGAVGVHLAISRESLTSILNSITVGIRVESDLPNDSWIAELAINLMARLYPRVAIVASPVMRKALIDLATRINPVIEIADETPASSTLCVGSADFTGAIFPSADGWVARVHHQSGAKSGVNNPYAAGAAAALACAQPFRPVFFRAGPQP